MTKGESPRDAARELLAVAGIDGPPVDLARVAEAQGITEIKTGHMGGRLLGRVTRRGGRLVVTLNERETLRNRFTLAHEIAHTIVEPGLASKAQVVLASRKPATSTARERLCDELAAELLLPYDMFRAAMNGEAPSLAEAKRLARTFDASLLSTALRMGHVLAEEPVQVVQWKQQGSVLKAWAKAGQPLLTGEGTTPYRALSDESSAIACAFNTKGAQRGSEQPRPDAPWLKYDVEAEGFLRGDRRYVISLARPTVIESEDGA